MYDEDGYSSEDRTRRRQAEDLEHVNAYYQLPERLGVQLHGDQHTSVCHSTGAMEYGTPDGHWVVATPLADRWSATSQAPLAC